MSDKRPLQSKKFTAFLISEISWKLLLLYVIMEYKTKIDHYAFMVILAIVITSGFLQIGYVLGQAALDKYTAVTTAAWNALKTSVKRANA